MRRSLSNQNSISNNSDSGGELSGIQKSKINFSIDGKSPSLVTSDSDTALDRSFKLKRSIKKQHLRSTSNVMLSGMSGGAGGGVVGIGAVGAVIGGVAGGGLNDNDHHNRHHHHHHQHKSNGSPGHLGRGYFVISLTLVAALCLLAIAATLLYQHFLMTPNRNSQAQRLRIVKRILRDVPLVDGHNNFAWNVRKYAHSSLELIHINNGNDLNHKSMWVRPAWAQTDIKRLQQGQVGVQVW